MGDDIDTSQNKIEKVTLQVLPLKPQVRGLPETDAHESSAGSRRRIVLQSPKLLTPQGIEMFVETQVNNLLLA